MIVMHRQRHRGITVVLAAVCLSMLVLAHEVIGRLRFASPMLKNDRRHASHLECQVRAVPGVTNVQIRHNTGSLIVLHDGAQGTRQAILRTLAIVPPAKDAHHRPLLDELAEAAAQHLLSIAARGVIAALL